MRILTAFLLTATAIQAAPPEGEALYRERCGVCHDGKAQPRMPDRNELAARAPEAVVRAMFSGAMMIQSAGLSEEEGRAIARFVTGKEFGAAAALHDTAARCPAVSRAAGMTISKRDWDSSWNGWGKDLDNSRYQPQPGLAAVDVPKLKLKWAFGFPNDIVRSAQPAIVAGRVYVGSASGVIYSLDAASGCTYWTHDAGAMVRTAITIGQAGGKTMAYFGDTRAIVHALDAATGQEVWQSKVEDHPAARVTGAPTFYNGRLYVPVSSVEEASAMLASYECCKFRGSIVALDGATGKQVWKSFSVTDPAQATRKTAKGGVQQWGPAGAAIWSSPTIDVKNNVIYAATGNSYTDVSINTSNAILAFDLKTGSLLWSSQATPKDNFNMACGRNENCPEERGPDFDFGSSPILRALPGGQRVLICGQKSGVVWGLDPDHRGKVLWQTRVGKGGALGGIEWGPSADGEVAFVAVSDLFTRGGGGKPGGLHAVRLDGGQELWNTPAPELHCTAGAKGCTGAQSAAITSMPGIVFSGSVDGHFRAFAAKTGEIVWDVDTVQDYQTVNGVPGKGGSLDSAGPVIANGMVFTNSGYGLWQGLPGNVLLAFSVDGK
jgi:polyvinyl alcohol dehydrogenase (cytochrome)